MWKAIFFLLFLYLPAVFAHGLVHEQIHDLSHQIEDEPNNVELYIKRGRLFIDGKHYTDARKDFERALKLNQESRSAHYFLGQVALKEMHYMEAEQQTRKFLDSLDGEPGALTRGYRQLGEIYNAKGDYQRAAAAFQSAIKYSTEPRPGFFLDLADVYLKQGGSRYSEALDALDQGVKHLGELAVFEDKSVEVEVSSGKYDAALKRLDAMIAKGKRLPFLYSQKGDILSKAGHIDDAKQAYSLALTALDHLSPGRRNSEAMITLRNNLVAKTE